MQKGSHHWQKKEEVRGNNLHHWVAIMTHHSECYFSVPGLFVHISLAPTLVGCLSLSSVVVVLSEMAVEPVGDRAWLMDRGRWSHAVSPVASLLVLFSAFRSINKVLCAPVAMG